MARSPQTARKPWGQLLINQPTKAFWIKHSHTHTHERVAACKHARGDGNAACAGRAGFTAFITVHSEGDVFLFTVLRAIGARKSYQAN